jgi:P27 family predicted phage terminase small subunit
MQGRKPKPMVLKNLHNPEKARDPADEPQPSAEIADPPEHFEPEQRQVWMDALAAAPPTMLKEIDASVLETWVVARVLHRRAVRALGKSGLIVKSPNGHPIQSPWLPIINRQALIMLRAASELGFSPTSRPRVGATLGGRDLNGQADGAPGGSLDAYLAAAPETTAVH